MRQNIAAGSILLLAACADNSGQMAPAARISFVVRGSVNDTAYRPVGQSTLEVVDGPQAGAVTTTDNAGNYAFTTTFTESFTLRASKDGYLPATAWVEGKLGISSSGASLRLASPTAPVDLAGNWVVTLTADTVCTNLPAIARTRTYPVTITRGTFQSTTFQGAVTGSVFFVGSSIRYDRFVAGVFGDFVRFSFYSPDLDNGLVEEVGPDSYVTITGEADAVVAGSTVDVPFSGYVGHCSGARSGVFGFQCSVLPNDCSSKNHRLTLTRQ